MDREPLAPPGYCRGLDGKIYPRGPRAPDDRAYLIGRAHYLKHDERLSIRSIVATIFADHGVRVSVGTVHSWLNTWGCDWCSGASRETPEQQDGGG